MPYIRSQYVHDGTLLKGLAEGINSGVFNLFLPCMFIHPLEEIFQSGTILAIQNCKLTIILQSKCLIGRDFLTGYITSQDFATGYISLTSVTGLTLTAANPDHS